MLGIPTLLKSSFKTQKRPLRFDQSGQSVVMGLIGVLIVGLISAYFAIAYQAARRTQARSSFFNFVAQIQLDIRNTINSAPSWQSTISDITENGTGCLTTSNCTTPVSATAFVLWPAGTLNYSNKAKAIYDGTDPTAGFTLDGTPCSGTTNGFSPGGSPKCPIHLMMTWATSGCTPAPCTPQITISIGMQFRPGPESPIGPINEQNYSLIFTQKTEGGTELCSGEPSQSVLAQCANPPYPQDKIFCLPNTPGGWACGQVFY